MAQNSFMMMDECTFSSGNACKNNIKEGGAETWVLTVLLAIFTVFSLFEFEILTAF